jgi:cytochrome c553
VRNRAGFVIVGLLLAGAFELSAQASSSRGEALFTGRVRFKNGAPACGSCHSVGGSAFPKGGTMGPDLTHEYSKLGAAGMQATLETLYFPAMNALFAPRPLTPDEQQDLTAFFQNADRNRPENLTGGFSLIALAGFAMLLGITWLKGRRRIRSVRGALLERAGGAGR